MTVSRPFLLRNPALLLLFWLSSAAPPFAMSQAGPAAEFQANRQKAADLFDAGKRLEALPLLESLVQANPKDDEMLVALAACLIDHAATLPDQQAAARERFRARDLLDRAWKLGNTSPLALNLSQLLAQLPASGSLKFSDNPQAEQFMLAGEAAFSRRDFDQARKNYSQALELDPANYSAALFIANSYDKQDRFADAAENYQHAIQLDPDVETAYRYYADMLARQGNMSASRSMLIRAAVAEPYNRIVWRELRAWAALNNTHINQVYIAVPAPPNARPSTGPGPAPNSSPNVSAIWDAYRSVRATWQNGGEFKKHFPNEKEYRHTLPEESEALAAAANAWHALLESKTASDPAANDPALSLLLNLHHARLLEPYVLLSLGDPGIARDYAPYRAGNRDKLEQYMDKFVVPPAP